MQNALNLYIICSDVAIYNICSHTDDDWGANTEDTDYIGENVTLPRIPGPSPDRVIPTVTTRGHSPNSHQRRRPAELRQRSPSPHQLQYTSSSRNNNSGNNNGDVTSPRERFQDAKEMFRAMEREAIARPIISVARREIDSAPTYRYIYIHTYNTVAYTCRTGCAFCIPRAQNRIVCYLSVLLLS